MKTRATQTVDCLTEAQQEILLDCAYDLQTRDDKTATQIVSHYAANMNVPVEVMMALNWLCATAESDRQKPEPVEVPMLDDDGETLG